MTRRILGSTGHATAATSASWPSRCCSWRSARRAAARRRGPADGVVDLDRADADVRLRRPRRRRLPERCPSRRSARDRELRLLGPAQLLARRLRRRRRDPDRRQRRAPGAGRVLPRRAVRQLDTNDNWNLARRRHPLLESRRPGRERHPTAARLERSVQARRRGHDERRRRSPRVRSRPPLFQVVNKDTTIGAFNIEENLDGQWTSGWIWPGEYIVYVADNATGRFVQGRVHLAAGWHLEPRDQRPLPRPADLLTRPDRRPLGAGYVV